MGNAPPDDDGVVHDEVEIEDFEYDPEADTFTYPCPCGDEFVVLRVGRRDNNRLTSFLLKQIINEMCFQI